MFRRSFNSTLVLFSILGITASSCKKEFDTPPEKVIPEGSVITIADLKAMYTGTPVHFPEDVSVYAVVTADETSGNLYKNVYVQDNTDAMNVRLLVSGGLYQGDSIRINLKGTVFSQYQGVYQLDSVDVDNNIVKQAVGVVVEPIVTTIDMLNSNMQSKLIQLNNVQFVNSELSGTYADAVNLLSVNRTLEDCDGNTVIVRTSGYANFASQQLAQGNGTFIGIMGEFNGVLQLYIRKFSDIQMSGARCAGTYLSKDFEDLSITSGGWTQQYPTGSVAWTASSFGSDNFGRISNYNGSVNTACESWFISPAMDLSTAINPKLTFRSACNYSGANIQVMVSTNFDGVSLVSSATWTALTPALSSGAWAWVSSGQLDMTPYIGSSVYIAFKYTGTNSDGKTWEIDDILLKEI
jgi:hypothetical protein